MFTSAAGRLLKRLRGSELARSVPPGSPVVVPATVLRWTPGFTEMLVAIEAFLRRHGHESDDGDSDGMGGGRMPRRPRPSPFGSGPWSVRRVAEADSRRRWDEDSAQLSMIEKVAAGCLRLILAVVLAAVVTTPPVVMFFMDEISTAAAGEVPPSASTERAAADTAAATGATVASIGGTVAAVVIADQSGSAVILGVAVALVVAETLTIVAVLHGSRMTALFSRRQRRIAARYRHRRNAGHIRGVRGLRNGEYAHANPAGYFDRLAASPDGRTPGGSRRHSLSGLMSAARATLDTAAGLVSGSLATVRRLAGRHDGLSSPSESVVCLVARRRRAARASALAAALGSIATGLSHTSKSLTVIRFPKGEPGTRLSTRDHSALISLSGEVNGHGAQQAA